MWQPFVLMEANDVATLGGVFDSALWFDIIVHQVDNGDLA